MIIAKKLRFFSKKDTKTEENNLTYFIRKRIINVSASGAESAVSKKWKDQYFLGGDNDESEFKTGK